MHFRDQFFCFTKRLIGHFFLAIDPKSFRAPGEFEQDLDDMIDALHASRRADPAQPVWVAGDPEAQAMEERTGLGVPVPEALLAQLRANPAWKGVPVIILTSPVRGDSMVGAPAARSCE